MPVNILVNADDIVLLSLSWRGLQSLNLIDSLLLRVESLDMSCNNSKTVCMILNLQNSPVFIPIAKIRHIRYAICIIFSLLRAYCQ